MNCKISINPNVRYLGKTNKNEHLYFILEPHHPNYIKWGIK